MLTLLTVGFPILIHAKDSPPPCPQIQFAGKENIDLEAMEIRLVCGDAHTEGWGRVPFNQAESFLRAFLQQRGYQEPSFTPGRDVLMVDPGAKTLVSSFSVTGLPPGVDPRKFRKIRGQVMTPKLLDTAKAALLGVLQNRGYACPEVEIRGNGATGQLSAEVRPRGVYFLNNIRIPKTDAMSPEVFSRYEAFKRGQRFDGRLLDLTAQRALADSLFLSAYFDITCSTEAALAQAGEGLTITGRVVAGKSQLYKLGIGFDTEGLFIGKAQWQDSRIGARANSMEGTLYASLREQTAVADYRYYTGPGSRVYLMPKLTFGRLNNTQFESIHSELALLPSLSRDSRSRRTEFSAGPALEYANTIRGPGPGRDSYGSLITQLEFRGHDFEYYAGDPRTGGRVVFKSQSRLKGAGSVITAHILTLQGEHVWNLGGYEPPALVLATRYLMQGTLVRNSLLASGKLPLDTRFFMGGDANLRGAGFNKVPSDAAGLLTSVYDGLELRLMDVFSHGIQPLIFLDAAMGGRGSFRLDPNVYYSPGFGVRWSSPVGSIRATLARGLVWKRDPSAEILMHPSWQFFLSLGKEF